MPELVAKAMTGDREAFNGLCQQIGDDLLAIARRILRDRQLAEDAVQSSLFEAWRGLPTLQDQDRFEAWIYRLLVRQCYQLARRQRHWTAEARLEPVPANAPDHASLIADRDAIERSFMHLSPEHRAVVVLHHYRGLSLVEVAGILGIPAGTAYSRLHYAHERLRVALTAGAESVPSRGLA